MHTVYNLWLKLQAISFLHAFLLIILGYFVSRFVSLSAEKTSKKHFTLHQAILLKRILFYGIFLLFLASAVQQLGFRINALLGATGILTVAIGIAAQTSMSNLISGLFIIGEKPFEIGDTIKVNSLQGAVLSIDFLSVKIRTNDNTMIRIPNETLIKSCITNLSFFPMRRVDLIVSIGYKEKIDDVSAILLEIARQNKHCLEEPKPTVALDSFGDSAINLSFCCWVKRGEYNEGKNTLQKEIKVAFDQHHIDIPYPSRTFYSGNLTEPLPVKIIGKEEGE